MFGDFNSIQEQRGSVRVAAAWPRTSIFCPYNPEGPLLESGALASGALMNQPLTPIRIAPTEPVGKLRGRREV